jgi:hypothetical protein
LKMDEALSIFIKTERGDAAQALKETIAEMRADIQFLRWPRLKSEEFVHFNPIFK